MAGSALTRGNVATTVVLQVTLTPVAVTTITATEQLFVVPGVQVGDQVSSVSLQAAWTGLTGISNVRVTAPNQIGITFNNGTAGSLTPPAGIYWIEVNRAESLPLTNNAY